MGSIPSLSVTKVMVVTLLILAGCNPKAAKIATSLPETIIISGFVRTEDGQPVEGITIIATTTDCDGDTDCDLRDWSFSQNQEPQNWLYFLPHMKGPGIPWITQTEK